MCAQVSNLNCPECHAAILEDDINVGTDIAKCDSCGQVFRISDQIGDDDNDRGPRDTTDLVAPSGTKFVRTSNGFVLSASTRSKIAWFLVPFSAVWIGGSMGGIYGAQIVSGQLDPTLSLFGVPFVIGSMVLGAFTAMKIVGKVVNSAEGYDGSIFTGVGGYGWKRNFSWSDVDRVREDVGSMMGQNAHHQVIRLEGRRRISFGFMLSDEKRYFLLKTLETLLREKR